VNKNLFDFKLYLNNSIVKMELFLKLNKFSSYKLFCDDVEKHLLDIKEFKNKIDFVRPFELSIKTTRDMGSLLSSYYELKHNPQYDKSLRFSLSFDGYMDNLSCLYNHIESRLFTPATYENNSKTSFVAKKQIYPPHSCLSDVMTNDVDLKRNMIITGPNASGKTTYIKMTAINIILSQQFGCGYYKRCSIVPFTHIHSYINIPDTSERDSLFQAESRRCKNIIDTIDKSPINSKHFCIFDELYTGTTSESSAKASYSFLTYLCKRKNVKFLLTTHYKNVCKKMRKIDNIINYKMDVLETQDGLKYSYQIVKGISEIDGAIHVLKGLNYPNEIIQTFLTNDCQKID
jgi:DNA mismatch repair ATPase MutS